MDFGCLKWTEAGIGCGRGVGVVKTDDNWNMKICNKKQTKETL